MGNLGNMGNKVATIGFFDGLHEGHRYVVSQVIKLAKERGEESVVFTFRNHPASLFAPDHVPPMLLTAEEKEERLTVLGVDKVIMLDFNKELASLSAADFLEIMANKHGVTALLLGYDNHFGRKERRDDGTIIERTFEDYVRLGKDAGIEVLKLDEFRNPDTSESRNPGISESRNPETPEPRNPEAATSSTLIRNLLLDGNLAEANKRLGYDYFIEGKVVHGKQIGRTIGFPTANIEPPAQKLIPKRGVYAAKVTMEESRISEIEYREPRIENRISCLSVVNIGTRPTFNGESPTIEAHIIDFSGNLYDKSLRIEFHKRLRDEQRFTSEAQLIKQINKDKITTIHFYEQQLQQENRQERTES